LYLKSNPGAAKGPAIVKYLTDLKRHLGKKKLLLFWDGLPAHGATVVKQFLKKSKSWLRVARMPGYAPELNPPEYLWAAMKTKDCANLRPDGMRGLGRAVRKGYRRIRKRPDLLVGFLKASRLF
jgi:transposase